MTVNCKFCLRAFFGLFWSWGIQWQTWFDLFITAGGRAVVTHWDLRWHLNGMADGSDLVAANIYVFYIEVICYCECLQLTATVKLTLQNNYVFFFHSSGSWAFKKTYVIIISRSGMATTYSSPVRSLIIIIFITNTNLILLTTRLNLLRTKLLSH